MAEPAGMPDEEAAVADEPVDEPETLPVEVHAAMPQGDLLSLEEAVQRIPESLRQQMKDLLKGEFREVRRWKPGPS